MHLLFIVLALCANLCAKENVKAKQARIEQTAKKTKGPANKVPATTKREEPRQATKLDSTGQNERTFAIIKPDAVEAGVSGDIIKLIELNKFKIIRLKKVQLTRKQAESFYKVHKEREFFPELIKYITSGPVIALALERENGVKEWRNLMGATNPEKAPVGTIRKMFGTNMTRNATHGSDSPENAQIELLFFFPDLQYS